MHGSRKIRQEGSPKALVRNKKSTLKSRPYLGNKQKALYTRYFHRPRWKRLFTAWKISDVRIVLAVDASASSTNEDLDVPERSRIVKLANSVTYDRYIRPGFACQAADDVLLKDGKGSQSARTDGLTSF